MNGGAKSFCEAKNSWEPSKAKAQFRRRELPYSTVISSVSRFGYCEACQQPDRSSFPYYAKFWKMFTKKVLPTGYFIISSKFIKKSRDSLSAIPGLGFSLFRTK
jgi:hypothetical protein